MGDYEEGSQFLRQQGVVILASIAGRVDFGVNSAMA